MESTTPHWVLLHQPIRGRVCKHSFQFYSSSVHILTHSVSFTFFNPEFHHFIMHTDDLWCNIKYESTDMYKNCIEVGVYCRLYACIFTLNCIKWFLAGADKNYVIWALFCVNFRCTVVCTCKLNKFMLIISASERSSLQWDPQADLGAPLAVGRQRIRVKVYSFLHSFLDSFDYALEFRIIRRWHHCIQNESLNIIMCIVEKVIFDS